MFGKWLLAIVVNNSQFSNKYTHIPVPNKSINDRSIMPAAYV